MRARLPYEYDHRSGGKRKQAVATAMLLFCRALWETGCRSTFINQWIGAVNVTTAELGGYNGSGFFNREWPDMLAYWQEKVGIEMPRDYRLIITGELTAYGDEQKLLVPLECFALTKLGYGEVRIRRVFEKYAEISGMHEGGRAKYTRKELHDWADGEGLEYK